MKGKFVSLLFLALKFLTCYGQDGILFKKNYIPESDYRQTTTMITKGISTYSGSELFLEKLKEKGLENPTKMNTQLVTETTIHTGKKSEEGVIPVVIEYTQVKIDKGQKPIPEGTKFYGRSSSTQLLILDSISSSTLTEATKAPLLKSVQSTFSQLLIPENRFKIGDTFEQEIPLSIPIADITIDMIIKSTYKLISITNDIALFEIPQVYTMTSKISEIPITAIGTGNGQIRFDLKHNYFLSYESHSELKMKMDFGKFILDLTQETNFTQQTSLVE